MSLEKYCPNCNKVIVGRSGKRFCTEYCKSNYHYENNKVKENSFFKRVDAQLKSNRRLLRQYNKAGKSTIRAERLLETGFDPNFFTHYWKNKQGDVYLFCYEYGFLKRSENGATKYVLVTWQSYMDIKLKKTD